MAVGTTAAILGAAIIGAGATVHATNQQKKEAKRQERRLKEQETEVREIAKLDMTKDSADADFNLGRDAGAAVLPGTQNVARTASVTRNGGTRKRVGGIFNTAQGVARRIGL